MNWMKSKKSSWAYLVVIAFATMVALSMSSCGVPATPTPTSTARATAAATPSYPVPTLVSPASEATIMGEKQIKFSWHWDGALQEGEKFDLRIWRSGKPCRSVAIWDEEKKCSFLLDTPPDGFGQYLWQVAIVRIDKSGSKSTLCESLIWLFVWSDALPTPKSTVTLTPTVLTAAASPSIVMSTVTYTTTWTPTSTDVSMPTDTPMPALTPTPISIPTPPKPCFDTRFRRIEDSGGAIQEVRGYVYDINGQPLRNAVVEIYVKRLWSEVNSTWTNTTYDGGFAFIGLGGNTNNEYIVRVIGMPEAVPAYHTWEEPYTFKFNTTHDRAVVFIYQIPFRADLCHLPEEIQ